jgi:hypothetical protein
MRSMRFTKHTEDYRSADIPACEVRPLEEEAQPPS